ncbi:MAG: efflux RND transporter permease subunit [Alphaproteobacteria bacterium]|nr:efflux RND transporter permease subunit [Alphaproteobacteria bacterium]
MNLIRHAIQRPVGVAALVLMVVLFGLIALARIPIQLAPDVRRPIISIDTDWPGASPEEVEREIVIRQENALRGLEGVTKVSSSAQFGGGSITLEFGLDRDINRSLLLTANKLDRVADLPEEADEPSLSTAGNEDTPIVWFVIRRAEGNDRPIEEFGSLINDVVKDRFERVPGVARANIFGGREREVRIVVDPFRMAAYRLTITDVMAALRAADASITAGWVDEGKRRYVVRTEGDFDTVEDIANVVLRVDQGGGTGRVGRVLVGDIGRVVHDYAEPQSWFRALGEPAMSVNAVREAGANVLDVMTGLRAAADELNAGPLGNAGLYMAQTYDETVYIESAIDLVRDNIWMGGALAAAVLLLFLRSLRATLVVALAMPVSIIGTFIAMVAVGRSINVISLAGIAFSVGMVVDAAIVVLESIHRQRERGRGTLEAAEHGARLVWGAVLGSALTTVAAFVPILLMADEVGQLFRDIAVAISVSTLLSLVVAVTVIPPLAARLLGDAALSPVRIPVIDGFADAFAAAALALTRAVVRSRALALLLVAGLCGGAGVGTWLFLPDLEYLPEGNRNMVFGSVQTPPGYNLETAIDIAQRVEDAIRPQWASESGPESAPGEPPKIQYFFIYARAERSWLGAVSVDPLRAGDLIPVLTGPVLGEPGTFAFFGQASLFGRGLGGGRSIDLDIGGGTIEEQLAVARRAAVLVEGVLPQVDGNQMRPNPGLELGAPEIRVEPDPVRLADAGLSTRALGTSLDAFTSGVRVSEIEFRGRRVDLLLGGPEWRATRTQGIGEIPVVTPDGQVLPASALADIALTAGPQVIRREERERIVTLQIRPADTMPLETAIERIEAGVIEPLKAEGLPPGVRLGLSGTADKLTETWGLMQTNLLIAVAVVFLVMVVLFESFLYPFIIMLSVPLATAGGVAGLALLNVFTFQALDMLTLLGFVILIGTVVNNAVLIVHQTLTHMREGGLDPEAAILAATGDRLRPIFMSTLTSVVGMLPLVLFPGAGSELYRGLGSVVVGGLSLSAILTIAVIPPLLAMTVPRRRAVPAQAA